MDFMTEGPTKVLQALWRKARLAFALIESCVENGAPSSAIPATKQYFQFVPVFCHMFRAKYKDTSAFMRGGAKFPNGLDVVSIVEFVVNRATMSSSHNIPCKLLAVSSLLLCCIRCIPS